MENMSFFPFSYYSPSKIPSRDVDRFLAVPPVSTIPAMPTRNASAQPCGEFCSPVSRPAHSPQPVSAHVPHVDARQMRLLVQSTRGRRTYCAARGVCGSGHPPWKRRPDSLLPCSRRVSRQRGCCREQHGLQARMRAAQSPGVHASEAQSRCGSCPHLRGVVSCKLPLPVPRCGH